MNEPVAIRLDEADREWCLEYQNKVLGNVVGDNYTGLEHKNRYFTGACGELALKKWATSLSLVHKWSPKSDGRSDDGDFTFLHKSGRAVTADIKNSFHPIGANGDLLLSVDQKKRKLYDIYIGAQGTDHGDHVDINLWGVIQCNDLLSRPLKKIHLLNHYVKLKEMPISMERFARNIEVHHE